MHIRGFSILHPLRYPMIYLDRLVLRGLTRIYYVLFYKHTTENTQEPT